MPRTGCCKPLNALENRAGTTYRLRKRLRSAVRPRGARIAERMTEPRTYEEFWPFYVSQHLKPATQRLHFLGTTLVLAALVAAVLLSPWWALATPILGYAPAWIGHFGFERNRPATFRYPLWSLRGDFRMYRLMWLGRMAPEIERARRLYPPS